MSTYVPPKKNTAYNFYVALTSQADTKLFQVNPTLATGDVKVAIDNGSFNNLGTLPVVTPSGGRTVLVALSNTEMNGDNIQVQFVDAAGAEWCDLIVNIQTAARQIDDLAFPTTSGRSLDVTATGGAGIDWSNVEAPTTTLDLSGTTIKTSQVVASVTGAVGSVTGNVGGNVTGSVGSLATQAKADVNAEVVDVMTVDLLADSVATDGTRPTLAQAVYELIQFLTERSVAGTTLTVKKVDGSTSLMTFSLDSATAPTSITRAT